MKHRLSFILILVLLVLGAFTACRQTTTTTTEEGTTMSTTTTTTTSTTTTTTHIQLIDHLAVVTENPIVGELLEIGVFEVNTGTIASLYNPYDYSEIKLSVSFEKPSQRTITHNAFWFKEYDSIRILGAELDEDGYYISGQETVKWKENGISQYRVRINPDEAGVWHYLATLSIGDVIVEQLQGDFTVSEGAATNGYIRVDEATNKTFVFDSGETYSPMGLNLAWWSTTLGSHDYVNWFKRLNSHNANYARIWMANWSFSLHKDSYDNFETRQSIAIRLDNVLAAAKEEDVYIMLTLLNHGQFSSVTNPEWSENVYNEKNGGMLELPIQFFYNTEAKAAYKNELLYILARYGYSENIFAWELFNEVDWIDGYSAIAVTNWHNEMANFLHDNDPYQHLVTTSYKYTFGTPAYALDSIDFVAVHSYGYGDVKFYEKLVQEQTNLWNQYQKPVLFGEIGIDWQSGTTSYHTDYTGVTIRQALWGGLMSGAGSANHWWWDSWVEAHDMWYLFSGASTYAKAMNLSTSNLTWLHQAGYTTSNSLVKAMGYVTDSAMYGYLYNNQWNYWNKEPDAITNVSFEVAFPNGTYQLSYYDTITGEIISQSSVVITDGKLSLEGLTVTTDVAFILE